MAEQGKRKQTAQRPKVAVEPFLAHRDDVRALGNIVQGPRQRRDGHASQGGRQPGDP